MPTYKPISNFRVKDNLPTATPLKAIVGVELQREFEAINASITSMGKSYGGPLTNFAAKDLLATGNADKKVLGAALDAEFDAINTAMSAVIGWSYSRITTFANETTIYGDKVQDELDAVSTAVDTVWTTGFTGYGGQGYGGSLDGSTWVEPVSLLTGVTIPSYKPGIFRFWPNAVLKQTSQSTGGADKTPNGYSASGGVVTLSPPGKAVILNCTAGPSATLTVRVKGTSASGASIQEDIALSAGQYFKAGSTDFATITACNCIASYWGSDGFYQVGYSQHVPDSSSSHLDAYVYGALEVGASDNGLMSGGYPFDIYDGSTVVFMRYANSGTVLFTINGSEAVSMPDDSVGQEVESTATYNSVTSIADGGTSVIYDVGFKTRIY